MTTDERNELIEEYGRGARMLADALDDLPKEMLDFRPEPDAWSVHEIIVHLADSEVNGYIRCRRLIAEPSSVVMAYDQDLWAHRLAYQERDIYAATELFRWLRVSTYELLRSLSSEIWTTAIVHHPERGMMTLDDWLMTYVAHVRTHITQMLRNRARWTPGPAAGE
jgi:hypothetical protein